MTPAIATMKLYACADCGHEVQLVTNHQGPCYPACTGSCRQVYQPNSAREVVLAKQTTHHFIRDL